MNDKLSEIFGINEEHSLTRINSPSEITIIDNKSSNDEDYDHARSNIIDIIELGQDALSELKDLAVSSQMPSAYEALAKTIKTMIDANRDLVEMSRKKEQMDKYEKASVEDYTKTAEKTITNNTIIATNADVINMIQNAMKGKQQ